VSFVHVHVLVLVGIAVPLRLRGGVCLAIVACGRTSDAAALGVLGLTNPDRSPMLLHLGSLTLVGLPERMPLAFACSVWWWVWFLHMAPDLKP